MCSREVRTICELEQYNDRKSFGLSKLLRALRSRVSLKHPGNVRLRETVTGCYLKRYIECSSKFEKSLIVTEIVQKVKEKSHVGAFVRKIGDSWYKGTEQLAREKVGSTKLLEEKNSTLSLQLDSFQRLHRFCRQVGQLLRNLNPEKYKSSSKAKKAKRQADEYMYDEEVDHMMGQLGYADISQRINQLTVNATTDADFQRAFNIANSELLHQLKKATEAPNDNNPPVSYTHLTLPTICSV